MDADKMDKLKNQWHDMLADAKDILGQEGGERSLCDHWARTVILAGQPDKRKKQLELRRAIEKLVAFHRHVFTLIRFANSKRMRSSFFSSKITVIPAEETRPSVLSWPSNKREWGELLQSIYDKYELTRRSGVAVAKAEHKTQSKAEKCEVAEVIHCECAMVAYLHKNPALQAFSYIGVSRLSCKACHYWLKAFNGTMGTTFCTRGSHDKWYKGWARSGLGESDIQGKVDAVFLNFVEEALCKHRLGQGMARKSGASDSTDSSEQMTSAHRALRMRKLSGTGNCTDGIFDSHLGDY